MKKQSPRIIFLWMLIAVAVASGTFLIVEHLGAASGRAGTETGMVSSAQPDADAQQDDSANDAMPSASVAMQTFSNDGYEVNVPASWSIEKTGTDTIALHSNATSSAIACKIEVSAFPFSAGADTADWIAHRIGADPSLTVVEQSSEDISFASGEGVKWIGTIDDMPTTLVYAFNDQHAYEIAPSVIREGADGSAPCDDMLQTFLSGLKI